MPTDPTGAALLRTVCLDPDDVAARLVYADWLEQEGGQPERGEFIRLQCELASPLQCEWMTRGKTCPEWNADVRPYRVMVTCPTCDRRSDLRRRERELLDGLYGLGLEMLPAIDGLTRSNFVGGGGYGWFPREVSPAPGIEATFRRGFVEAVACTAEAWERHGPAVVLAQPVREVRLVGAEPVHVEREPGFNQWAWSTPLAVLSPRPEYRRASLPQDIYDLCNGWYATEQAALDALSRACVTWARRQAGLDVPCPTCRGAGEVWNGNGYRWGCLDCGGIVGGNGHVPGTGWVAAR